MPDDAIHLPARLGRTIAEWRSVAPPHQLQSESTALVERIGGDDNAWISVAGRDGIARKLAHAAGRKAAGHPVPLFGVPFAVKDNIDVAGFRADGLPFGRTSIGPAVAERPLAMRAADWVAKLDPPPGATGRPLSQDLQSCPIRLKLFDWRWSVRV